VLLFAGLGNPGPDYSAHRHNVGFMAADAIARRHGFSPWGRKFQGLIAEGQIDGEKIVLLKPQTYMNLSGQSVGEAMRFYKIPLAAITVFHDELDLAEAKVRVKVGGGNGGHNGLRSIDAHCGKDYRRVRIGIGHPGVKELVHNHVLGNFAKADREWLEPLLDAMADNVALLCKGDDNGFMNKATLAVPGGGARTETRTDKPAQKAQSHVRQARSPAPAIKLPETGPMAAMLKKLFGGSSD
jgi:PTH1 family peptidyl-tRNA hydrolase